MGAHAVRNASGSKRWMNCPGSIREARLLARRGIRPASSHYARLGTAAHGLCEASLQQRVHPREWVGGVVYLDEREDAHVFKPSGDAVDEHVEVGLARRGCEAFPIDDNMADAVAVYYETILADLEEMGPHAELSVERRFNLNWLVGYDFDEEAYERDHSYISPSGIHRADTDEGDGLLYYADGRVCNGPMFGTNDASIFLPFDLLRVYDYKHGQGVVVEVEDNSQEMYYALGIAHEVGWAFDEMELVIIQPRAPHQDGAVRRWRTTAARLREFEAELRVAAERCEDPEAPVVAGDWCGFCPVAAYCVALREQAFGVALIDFADVGGVPVLASTAETGALTQDDDLQVRLDAIPLLDAFVKAVEGEAMRRLREAPGGEAFGYKLVRKKSNRSWRTDLEAPQVELLTALGFPKEDLYEPPKMKGPAKVEKLRPPALMASLKAEGVKAPARWIAEQVAGMCHKLEGGITIAASSDPRPAVDPSAAAAGDFDPVEEFGEAAE